MLSNEMVELGSKRSCIRELFEYGKMRAAKMGPESVYDFSLGNPSVPAPSMVDDSIRDILCTVSTTVVHGYTSAPGCDEARDAIAEDLNRRFGTNYDRNALYLTYGAAMTLTSTIKALTVGSESEFVALAPCFPEYSVFACVAGGKLRIVEPDEPTFQINFPALENAVTEHTQAVIVNTPNNPTGVVYTEATIKRLAAFLKKKSAELGHAIYIISDEPYRELVYDGLKPCFIPNYYKDTIVCYSYSKSLSLPGERIGYVLISDEASDAANLRYAVAGASRALGCVCAPSLMQLVIARCAKAGVAPDLEPYMKNRDTLCVALGGMGYEFVKPSGAFYLFVKAPGGDSVAFSEKAKEHGVLVVPGEGFSCPGWIRICYCVDENMIKRALPEFEKLIRFFEA